MRIGLRLLVLVCLLFNINVFAYAEKISLNQILTLLQDHNPNLLEAEANQNLASGALTTAKQYPNPDIEIGGGGASGLGYGALNGIDDQIYLSQALDLPFVREARRQVAEAGIDSADQAHLAVWLITSAKTRQAYFEILRREAELLICQDNERILSQIWDKVALKVKVGESAKYEEVKAETELLNAVKLSANASIMVTDAKSALRALFAESLPDQFEVIDDLPSQPKNMPSLVSLQENVLSKQPLLHHARAEVEKARARVHYEEQMRYPQPVLKAGTDHDPGLNQWRIGISIPLPIWNQRQGPIAEALANLKKAEAQASQQELSLLRELQNAYNRYLISHKQVEIFESSLLKHAETTLSVAESAYKLGARGILDYLDAQRTYRNVRNDYINARFDLQNALIDLERLNAEKL